MTFKPTEIELEKYAKVLIDFALNDCKGIKKGQTVLLQVPECAKPMLIHLRRAVLKSGGNAIVQYLPDDMGREVFELSSDEQLSFFPKKYVKGLIDVIDHSVYIIAETNKKELQGIDPKKIMLKQKSFKPSMKWREDKENSGKFTWTLGMYPTKQMAKEANMSVEEYWKQIVKACFLDKKDPIKEWQKTYDELERIKTELNKLKIEKVHVKSKSTDLWVKLGKKRQWLGGSGRNIPSFELFISPDCRGTEGTYYFTEPLYRYGTLIKEGKLEFKKGCVVKSSASHGEDVFKEMVAQKNADKLGEFSLTDKRFSRITKFMGETLFDENVGGKYGNTHVAVGQAYKDSCTDNPAKVTTKQWKEWGFNESIVHTDLVSTENRVVTAYLSGGKTKVIYKDGQFKV
jgi:aminopeptidase